MLYVTNIQPKNDKLVIFYVFFMAFVWLSARSQTQQENILGRQLYSLPDWPPLILEVLGLDMFIGR